MIFDGLNMLFEVSFSFLFLFFVGKCFISNKRNFCINNDVFVLREFYDHIRLNDRPIFTSCPHLCFIFLAWDKKIVLVSPTTLLATLTTVASIWKHEKQTQNALEIARQGGALYDKFVGFLKNIEDLGVQLGRVNRTYDEAKNKLSEGRGNLVRQVENLKVLGAKTSKSIPKTLLENSEPKNETNES